MLPPPVKRAPILIVDDNFHALEALAAYVEAKGYGALRARHGGEALDLLERGLRPGMLLVDVLMPVMNGIELAEKLHRSETLSQIPLVMMTAQLDEPLPTGALAMLQKPVDTASLMALIAKHCGR
jgi:CheY-like chemotaxis protein